MVMCSTTSTYPASVYCGADLQKLVLTGLSSLIPGMIAFSTVTHPSFIQGLPIRSMVHNEQDCQQAQAATTLLNRWLTKANAAVDTRQPLRMRPVPIDLAWQGRAAACWSRHILAVRHASRYPAQQYKQSQGNFALERQWALSRVCMNAAMDSTEKYDNLTEVSSDPVGRCTSACAL